MGHQQNMLTKEQKLERINWIINYIEENESVPVFKEGFADFITFLSPQEFLQNVQNQKRRVIKDAISDNECWCCGSSLGESEDIYVVKDGVCVAKLYWNGVGYTKDTPFGDEVSYRCGHCGAEVSIPLDMIED